MEPRIRVSSILRWQGRVLLCRQEKPGKEYWLLPGGGVASGETLIEALRRELREELAIEADVQFEGPVAIVDSIAPKTMVPSRKHVVHIIFSGDLEGRSPEAVTSKDAAVRGHRLFDVARAPDQLNAEVGSGLALIGPNGALPDPVQRALLALTRRPALSRPLFAAVAGVYEAVRALVRPIRALLRRAR